MKVVAKLDKLIEEKDGTATIMLKVENIRHAKMCEGISDNLLSVEINDAKSKRSIEQNKYMWALLHEIDVAVNGERSNSEWDIYCQCLEKAGAKFEYMQCRIVAEDMLKKYFRAVQFAMPVDDDYAIYKCYYGSSTMNSKEMTKVIDCVLDMAVEVGIEDSYWRSVLK